MFVAICESGLPRDLAGCNRIVACHHDHAHMRIVLAYPYRFRHIAPHGVGYCHYSLECEFATYFFISERKCSHSFGLILFENVKRMFFVYSAEFVAHANDDLWRALDKELPIGGGGFHPLDFCGEWHYVGDGCVVSHIFIIESLC